MSEAPRIRNPLSWGGASFTNDGMVDFRKVQSALRDQDAVLDPSDMLKVR
jgi:hypothetical protein